MVYEKSVLVKLKNYESILNNFKKFNYLQNALYFSVLILFIFFTSLRNPQILFEGRFLAEEGSLFWTYSLNHTVLETLLYTPVIQGYYALNINLQILLSSIFPLTLAPLVTVWSSLLISIIPSFLYFSLNNVDNNRSIFDLIVSVTLLFLPSLNFLEIFANSINVQTYLGVSTFIILIYGLNIELYKYDFFLKILLILGFFSGYYSLILLPLFIVRFTIEKNKKLVFPIVFGFISIFINLNILYFTFKNSFLGEGKLDGKLEYSYFLEIIKKSILINSTSEKYFQVLDINNLLLAVFIVAICIFLLKNKQIIFLYILIAFFLEVFLVFIGQSGMTFDQRYAVVAPTIFYILIVNMFKKFKFGKYLVSIFLIIGIFNLNHQRSEYFINCYEYCLSWKTQILNLNSNPLIVHWPLGPGDPYWITDFKNLKPTPAPFQIDNFNDDFQKFYELNLIDIVNQNFSK